VNDGWIANDLRKRAEPFFRRSGVSSEFDFTTPEEIARHPYYQEFLRPHKLRWSAAVNVGDGPDFWCLSLQRSISEGPFSPNELRQLAGLSRRLASAAELARAFGRARTESALDAFEVSGSAAAMIDRNGRAIRLNGLAERLIGSDLQVVDRRFVSFDRGATAALERALRGLIWLPGAEALHPPIVLPRRYGRPILAYPSRAPIGFDIFAPCRAFVIFVDLQARIVVEPVELARAFGLTPAEARLASTLVDEVSVETAADKLGVTYESARKTLKNIFMKTDTHRQAKLVALAARFAKPSRE
jgi:DNA-binding CsgD family transcriptional regulator/PAS domain-containing protein